jgi:hypothetical protein
LPPLPVSDDDPPAPGLPVGAVTFAQPNDM